LPADRRAGWIAYLQDKGLCVQDEHDPDGYARVEQTAKGIDTARWWLDQRPLVTESGTISDLVDLLDAAASTHDGQLGEKPA
jgi:hypothetical protein